MIETNQVGSEDFRPDGVVAYSGDSAIIDPWCETIVKADETEAMLLTATTDLGRVDEVLERMRVLHDRRLDLYEL